MKKILSTAIEACILLCCLSIALGQTPQKPLENVFTLELQFGDKDVPSEYLLAQPYRIAVNDAGDIYVFDEYKVKVFDKNGKPKKIFGGQGQGPGEFYEFPTNFFISPTGWLTVSESQSYSIFSPANKFVDKIRYSSIPAFNSLKNDYKINLGSIAFNAKIFALNEKECIIHGNTATTENYNEENEYYDYLFHTNADKLSVLTKYRDVATFTYKIQRGGGSRRVAMLGGLWYAIISSSKILYTHTFHDVKFSTNTAQLTFHIVSLASNAKSEFSVAYKPEVIPDSVIKSYNTSSDAQKDMYKRIENAFKQRKYMPLFTVMRSDGIYIFLVKNDTESRSIKYIVTVINSESGKEVSKFIT